MRQFVSASPAETRALARRLSRCLVSGDVLLLQGNLGAGKTEFVKGLAEGLQVTDLVTSPTFTLLNVYHGAMPLYHFDLYRLEDAEELDNIGFEEFLGGDGVAVVEWPDRFPAEMPLEHIRVELLPGENEQERFVMVEARGSRYLNRLEGSDLF